MLADLDATIRDLLMAHLPRFIVEKISFSFAAPDDHFPPSTVRLPAVNIFLFLIEENRELRNREPTLERQDDGSVIKRTAPVRVDCHYLVTAFAEGAQQPEEDEHKILGEVMRVLLRHRTIPLEFLRGELVEQQPPVRAAALLSSPNQGAELWQALKGRPRASLHYVLTISVDTGVPVERFPPVTVGQIEGAA